MDISDPKILYIINMVNDIAGNQFENEKLQIAQNKILSRIIELDFKSSDAYYDYLVKNKKTELNRLISILTNHTTEFFREIPHFDFLSDEFFPKFIKAKKTVRIWSAACSTGQEPYSIAICYYETCLQMGLELESCPPIEIIGTDIDVLSIQKCRNGIYSKKLTQQQMSGKIFDKYFNKGEEELSEYVRIKNFIHSKCSFSFYNLLSSTDEIGYFDLILIRNVLIYFKPEDTKSIIHNMRNHLKPCGYLILGLSESIQDFNLEFVNHKNSIFQLKKISEELQYKSAYKIIQDKVSHHKIRNIDLIAIGSSTGGTDALKYILKNLKKESPPVLIIQHIPKDFTNTLVKQLGQFCNLDVYEARTNQVLQKGAVYIAPGGKQMQLTEKEDSLVLEVNDEGQLNMHKPSVDYTFLSIARIHRRLNTCAVILTGMGDDGAKGMKALYDKKAFTIAQDEKSSVVFGMPKSAIDLGGVHEVAALQEIPNILNKITDRK